MESRTAAAQLTWLGVLVPAATTASWFYLMVRAARSGAFLSWPGLGPLSAVQVAIVAPVVLFTALAIASSSVRTWTGTLDSSFLTGFQALRILGTGHLVSWGAGIMAGSFALPVGLGNLAIAAIALAILPRVAGRRSGWRRALWVLTLLGMAEFGMTIALAILGFFGAPTRFDPPVSAAGYMHFTELPLSIFPTFLIPFFLVVHVITLFHLREAHPAPQLSNPSQGPRG